MRTFSSLTFKEMVIQSNRDSDQSLEILRDLRLADSELATDVFLEALEIHSAKRAIRPVELSGESLELGSVVGSGLGLSETKEETFDMVLAVNLSKVVL